MKINKKGYSIVELLVVLSIMAILLIMVFPLVMNAIKDNERKEYEYYEKTMVEVAKLYYDQRKEPGWTGCMEFTYQELKNSNLLKDFHDENIDCNYNNQSKVSVMIDGKKVTYKAYISCQDKKTNEIVYQTSSNSSDSCTESSNILAVYKYDQTNTATKCITGEESTCVELTHSKDATYEKGTIVHYRVNDSESYYFHVIHDDGNTLTMQQREDTTTSQWYTSADKTKGPLTALVTLESETSDWSNVNDQTYTMGTTVFGTATNAYTGCSAYNSCTTNAYTMSARTGKSRMITVQEAAEQGCTESSRTCPIYMYNYLSSSISSGGTVNGSNMYYWTMSARSSRPTDYAWYVLVNGNVFGGSVTYARGVRAVVVVNK